jgi:hypothetical protein
MPQGGLWSNKGLQPGSPRAPAYSRGYGGTLGFLPHASCSVYSLTGRTEFTLLRNVGLHGATTGDRVLLIFLAGSRSEAYSD